MRPQYTRFCQECGQQFPSSPSKVRQGGGKYCSQKCHGLAAREDALPRFVSKLVMPPDNPTERCWLWIAARNLGGYGVFGVTHNGIVLAHRWAYEYVYGPIPKGLFVLHQCDVPACVNPLHLHLGDHDDNMREARERNRTPSGDRHNSRTKPESVPRGDNHWTRRRPEAISHRPRSGDFQKGETHWRAKLTEAMVIAIRERYATGTVTQAEIAADYGISPSGVGDIVRRKRWAHVA